MAMLAPARVRQITTTGGTVAAYTLVAATGPFRNFSDTYLIGAAIPYCCTDGSTGFEIGVGTFNGSTIQRTTVILSSNGGSLVNWAAGGTKEIFPWEIGLSQYPITFATSATATLADWGNTFLFTGSSLGSFTLPQLSTVPAGYTVTLKDSGSAIVNATPHSGDAIETLSTGVAFAHAIGSFAVYSSDLSVWRQTLIASPLAPGTAALPPGGSAGQMLRKTSGSDYAVAWQDAPMPIAISVPGAPPPSLTIPLVMTEPGSFPADFSGSYGPAGTASTGSVAVTIKKNATTIGTLTYATSATPTLATVSHAVQPYAAGDVIKFAFPVSPDATFADVAITLRAVRG